MLFKTRDATTKTSSTIAATPTKCTFAAAGSSIWCWTRSEPAVKRNETGRKFPSGPLAFSRVYYASSVVLEGSRHRRNKFDLGNPGTAIGGVGPVLDFQDRTCSESGAGTAFLTFGA